MSEAKQVEFTPPEGAIPAGTPEGESFESMATFEVKKGGRLCLKAIGDTAMPGYGQHEQPREPDPGKEVARKYRATMEGNL